MGRFNTSVWETKNLNLWGIESDIRTGRRRNKVKEVVTLKSQSKKSLLAHLNH